MSCVRASRWQPAARRTFGGALLAVLIAAGASGCGSGFDATAPQDQTSLAQSASADQRTVEVDVPPQAREGFERGARALVAALELLAGGVRVDVEDRPNGSGGSVYALTISGDKEQVGKAVAKMSKGLESLARAAGATVRASG